MDIKAPSFMGMPPDVFNHISNLIAFNNGLDPLLKDYTPTELIRFCRTTFSWIDQKAPTPINARRLYVELETKFNIEDYPELWI